MPAIWYIKCWLLCSREPKRCKMCLVGVYSLVKETGNKLNTTHTHTVMNTIRKTHRMLWQIKSGDGQLPMRESLDSWEPTEVPPCEGSGQHSRQKGLEEWSMYAIGQIQLPSFSYDLSAFEVNKLKIGKTFYLPAFSRAHKIQFAFLHTHFSWEWLFMACCDMWI